MGITESRHTIVGIGDSKLVRLALTNYEVFFNNIHNYEVGSKVIDGSVDPLMGRNKIKHV
jgi:hypothetical protein